LCPRFDSGLSHHFNPLFRKKQRVLCWWARKCPKPLTYFSGAEDSHRGRDHSGDARVCESSCWARAAKRKLRDELSQSSPPRRGRPLGLMCRPKTESDSPDDAPTSGPRYFSGAGRSPSSLGARPLRSTRAKWLQRLSLPQRCSLRPTIGIRISIVKLPDGLAKQADSPQSRLHSWLRKPNPRL
jgi:hypothetical protein